MFTLVIEKNALKQNISCVKKQAGSSCIYANLSSDGYGIGAVSLAKILREEGISHFCVDSVETAEDLRNAGLIDEEILMLRTISDPEILARLSDQNVICSFGSLESGMALNSLAKSQSTVIEAHLEIDCGLGFGGFPAEETDQMISAIRGLSNVAISGVYTQMSSGKSMDEQLELFQKAIEAIRAAGCDTGMVHAAGSYALLHKKQAHLDAVRAGSAFLGRCRRVRGDNLTLVGYGEVAIESMRWLPKGHSIGNEKQITLKKPTRVAVLPIGYRNGFGMNKPASSIWQAFRQLRKDRRTTVRINGKKAKILGSIGASETLVDVTSLTCSEGDIATFAVDPMYAKGFHREYR